jgi:two-component system NtrC family sensor kinase
MEPKLIAGILVLIGAGFMVFSIRLGSILKRAVPNKLKKRWQILILLKVFFLAGYLFFVSLLFSSYHFPLELVTGIIFLGGAFFVFIVINLSKDTIRSIKEKENEITEINRELEVQITERTAKYSNMNEQLMKYNAELTRTERDLKDSQDTLVKDHEKLQKIFAQVENAKLEWEKTVDCVSDIIIRTDKDGKITRFNKILQEVTGKDYDDIIGYHWEDFISDYNLEVTTLFDTSTELYHEPTGKWFMLNSYPFYDKEQQYSGNVITLHDNTETKTLEEAVVRDNARLEKTQQELKDAYDELKSAQSQMLQKEKMASIGQLAAGVAHEINNPMGFIASNISSLGRYTKKIIEFVDAQDEAIVSAELPELSKDLQEKRRKIKLDFILEDIDQLIEESLDGADRVKNIVQNLKSFSRVDEADHQSADINECIESTLNIVWNELKYKAIVTKDYGELPLTSCYPQQLNQVFMNLLVNAAQAIEKEGEITIRTWNGDGHVNISISDTGEGIPQDKLDKIFEPFYTTKPVGKGTGLGLSITYDILKKHNGELSVNSVVGQGTTFNLKIPVTGSDNH